MVVQARQTPSVPGAMGGWANWLSSLTGWKKRGVAVALGAITALALPPVDWLPVLLLTLPGLVWMLDGARSRWGAFGTGWWFGLGHFAAGLYWISNALLTDPAKFGWMIPFAILGLSGLLACFIALATLATHLSRADGWRRVLVLAGAWTILEWVRSWVLTGFPWNPLGSVWDVSAPVLQAASVVGVFGLSLMTVLAFAMPAVLCDPPFGRARRLAPALALLLPVLAGVAGEVRLASAPAVNDPAAMVPDLRFRLVQAAVDQSVKWRDDLREKHLADLVELSVGPGADRVTHVVWPETAVPFLIDQDPYHRSVASVAVPAGGLLLTGAPRSTPRGVQPFQLWNSLVAVGPKGSVEGIYDKAHLVPFGEYVPLRGVLPIAKITHGAVDFSAGPGPRTLHLPGLPPVGPQICYEDIFPAAVVAAGDERPQWLLVITNDGWFGLSAGPYQHLAAARFRAVEEGLPVMRAANTGVSAAMDGYGRTVASLGLGERGVVDAPLPRALEPTPFSRRGNSVPLSISGLLIAIGLWKVTATRKNWGSPHGH